MARLVACQAEDSTRPDGRVRRGSGFFGLTGALRPSPTPRPCSTTEEVLSEPDSTPSHRRPTTDSAPCRREPASRSRAAAADVGAQRRRSASRLPGAASSRSAECSAGPPADHKKSRSSTASSSSSPRSAPTARATTTPATVRPSPCVTDPRCTHSRAAVTRLRSPSSDGGQDSTREGGELLPRSTLLTMTSTLPGADIRGFYRVLEVLLPAWATTEASLRCFANPGAHAREDRDPSCSVNLQTGAWHCWGAAQAAARTTPRSRSGTPRPRQWTCSSTTGSRSAGRSHEVPVGGRRGCRH